MRTAVGLAKKPSLSKAFEGVVDLLTPEQRFGAITYETFSKCMAMLENGLLKMYCLYNYFEGQKENISDYIVKFDHLKNKN